MRADVEDIRSAAGTRQADRLPAPLADGFLHVEERDLAARLALLGDLARQIAFVDPGNRIAGTWEKLFLNEPAFPLAELASLSTRDAEQAFAVCLAEDWRSAVDEVARLAGRVSGWVERFAALPDSPFLRQIQVLDVKEDMSRKLQLLVAPAGSLEMARVRQATTATFDSDGPDEADGSGRARGPRGADAQPTPLPEDDPVARAHADRARIRAAHAMLLNVVTALRPTALRTLADRVASRRIDPALGLLIAELRAADLVVDRLNAMPARLIRFYYEEVLGLRHRSLPPERVLLRLPPAATPVHLPQGTRIEGRAGDLIWQLRTEAAMQVIPARVVGQAMLRYDTDPRISLFTSFAGITGLRAETFAGETPPGERQVFAPDPAAPFDMGIEIASPMFWLAEGERRIDLELDLEWRTGIDVEGDGRAGLGDLELVLREDPELVQAMGFRNVDAGVRLLTERVAAWSARTGQPVSIALLHEVLTHEVRTTAGLRVLLGRIVAAILIARQPWPSGAWWEVLRDKIARAGAGLSGQRLIEPGHAPQSLIAEAFRQIEGGGGFVYAPEDVFDMLLGDAFALSLSTAAGPMTPQVCRVRRNPEGRPAGIVFQIRLGPDAPAIAAPPGEVAPVVRILASPLARICPVSFLERFRLSKVLIRAEVRGLRALSGFSDDGRLDLAQSFAPFGPRPDDGARFVVAGAEMAVKPITEVAVTIDWAELPGQGAGFIAHYRGYGAEVPVPAPVMSAEYLSADGWKPLARGTLALFSTHPEDDRPQARLVLHGSVLGQSIPDPAATPRGLATGRDQLVSGAVRFTLEGTSNGFLAAEYPAALIRAMRPRLIDWPRRRMPRPPFVPRARGLSLDYVAQKVMSLNAPESARPGERITQITPFGRRTVFPADSAGEVGLFPLRLGYGAHFIQIDGAGALGPVSLLVELAESAHDRLPGPRLRVGWCYLAPGGWQELPDTALASDTTDGLMRSGVVTIDLPDDALRQSEEMPGTGYWLAAVVRRSDIDRFPILRRVQTNGFWAICTEGPGTPPDAPRSFAFVPGQPGVSAPAEVASDRPLQGPEDAIAFKTRVAEGLQHRQRAITPWDVERLVLAAFPEVWMVACLPGLDAAAMQRAGGHLSVVVVPHPPRLEPGAPPIPRLFDPLLLRRIEAHLRARAPHGARIRVRNPGYEVLQLRGRIRFEASAGEGALAQRLREDMARRLTVWTAPSALGRFGWSLNLGALHAEIEALPYVDRVTAFSVLHLVRNDHGDHVLHDTATLGGRSEGEIRLRAAEPWGLPLSAADHILTSTIDPDPRDAEPTGIGGLRVGEMLIVNEGAAT
ncbi:MAG: hypothetical protein ACXIU8_06680 [Alkalilacustris sp.]